jgi:Ca2+-binding RTX toxin-like protein
MTEFIEFIPGRSFNNHPDYALSSTLNVTHAGYMLVANGQYTRFESYNEPNWDESYFHYFEDGSSYSNAWTSDSYAEFTLGANGEKGGTIYRKGAPLGSLWKFAPEMVVIDRNNSEYLFRNVSLGNDGYDLFSFDDYLSTGDADDIIVGVGGNDRIIAGGGRDFISGGIGYNILTGGSGADEFAFVDNVTGGSARITDYNYNEGDTIGIKKSAGSDFVNVNTNLFIAKDKKTYKKGMRTSDSFVLDTRKRQLLYNADGIKKGMGYAGGGGVLIQFDNPVSNINFKFY